MIATHSPGRLDRAVVAVTAIAYAIVVPAPFVLSFASLTAWARDAVGLSPYLAPAVPLALDAAAIVSVCLTFLAVLRADAAGIARPLAWLIAAGSSVANARHGAATSLDAAILLACMPILTMTLVDIGLRRVLRNALAARGAVEPPVARFRFARWAIAPRETVKAWAWSVREQVVSPAEAIAASRRRPELTAAGVLDPTELAAEAVELKALSKAAAMRRALHVSAGDVPEAITYLATRGVTISATHAHQVARRAATERPQLAAVPTDEAVS